MKKEVKLFRERLFKKMFGFKLNSKPIGGLIIASEQGLDRRIVRYLTILKLVEPILIKLLNKKEN